MEDEKQTFVSATYSKLPSVGIGTGMLGQGLRVSSKSYLLLDGVLYIFQKNMLHPDGDDPAPDFV
jgi:hypothetical protein